MRTHRLFTPEPLTEGETVSLVGNPAHYLSRVLRLPEGTEIILFNGDGNDYLCRLDDFGRGEVRAQVLERQRNRTRSPLDITLCQAVSRGERMDYTLQKAAELGVNAVQLLLSERVEVKLGSQRLEKRLAHWRGVVESASEQCGRATVPELRAPIDLHTWLAGSGVRLVLDDGGEQALAAVELADRVEIAVGPEGGFSEAELDAMKAGGVLAVRLGPRIMRTETAGPAAIAVLQAIAGDFQ